MFSKRLQTRSAALKPFQDSVDTPAAPKPVQDSVDTPAEVSAPALITPPSIGSPVSSPPAQAAAPGARARPDDGVEGLMAAEAARHAAQLSLMARLAPSPPPGDASLGDLAAAESSRAEAMLQMLRPAQPSHLSSSGRDEAARGLAASPAVISQDVRATSVADVPNGWGGPPGHRFQVVHNQCAVRSDPMLHAQVLDVRQRGEYLTGVEETFDGWVRLVGEAGWMLRNMQGKDGLGVLLEPVGRPQKLPVPRLAADRGNQMFKIVCRSGAEIRSEPSEQASIVGSRAYGDFVFAETQSYHGWIRLADNVGWMMCFSGEKGEVLQHFDVDESESYENDVQSCKLDSGTGQPTIFDEVLSGESPVDVVHEDDLCLAFHEIDPQAPVHVLVIPKLRDGLTQLSKARDDQKLLLGHLMLVAGRLGSRLCAEGFRVVVNDGENGSQAIYHLHVHVLGGRPLGWPPG